MEGKKEKHAEWIKEHKPEIIVGAVGVGITTVAILLGMRYHTKIEEKAELIKNLVKKTPENISVVEEPSKALEKTGQVVAEGIKHKPHEVRLHPRKLPAGQNPSPEKLTLAAEMDLDLLPGYTWVVKYCTGEGAA